MNHARRANPSPNRVRRTGGLTVGTILGALAIVAVLVIVLLLVWRPGAAPADPDAQPSGAAAVEEEAPPGAGEDEAPIDETQPEAPAADGADEGAADETPSTEDVAGAEGDAPAEVARGADEAPPAAEEDAAPEDGEAPSEDAPAEGEEAPAEDGEAPADGEAPVADASLDIDQENAPAVRTDPTQRVAEVGEASRSTLEAVSNAIDEAESRLEGLEQATPDVEPPSFDLAPAEPSDGARVRAVDVTASANEVRDRFEAVSSAADAATRTTVERTDARVEVATTAADQATPARVRTASVGGAGAVSPPPLPEPSATRATGSAGEGDAEVALGGSGDGGRSVDRRVDPTVPSLEEAIRNLRSDVLESVDVTTASPADPADPSR